MQGAGLASRRCCCSSHSSTARLISSRSRSNTLLSSSSRPAAARRPLSLPRRCVVFAQQADRRVQRITVAGPPDGQPPRVIEVDDPQAVPVELISLKDLQAELQARQATASKSEAREQAAIIQAQKSEISSLRAALAETQDVMLKGKSAYNEVVTTKDLQIAQLYELAASGVRERAKLRQEVSDVQQELAGTRRQLHAFMASLMQLKSSMASAGEGDIEHALELLQSSSFSSSLAGAALGSGAASALAADDEVYAQLQQMQQLSETLVQDMRQDEALLSAGSLESTLDFDSIDSVDLNTGSSSGSSGGGRSSSPGGVWNGAVSNQVGRMWRAGQQQQHEQPQQPQQQHYDPQQQQQGSSYGNGHAAGGGNGASGGAGGGAAGGGAAGGGSSRWSQRM